MARTRHRLVTRLARRDEPTVRHWGRWLTVIAVGALILRIVYILYARRHSPAVNGGFFEGIGGDGVDYHFQALRNLHGHWFTMGDAKTAAALHPPGWTLILTLAGALGFKSIFDQQMLSALIGTGTVIAVAFAGRKIAGPGAGLIAAAIAAVYPGTWIYERDLLSETPLLLGVAVLLLLVYRFREVPTIWRAMGIGVVCGLLALTRSEQILMLPLLVMPLVLGRREVAFSQRVLWLALSGVCALVVLAPWTAYNQPRFSKPVVLSLGLGNAAVVGNCDASYYGHYTGWYGLACGRVFIRDESVQEAKDRQIAIDYAKDHLGRLPVVMIARQGRADRPGQPLAADAGMGQPTGSLDLLAAHHPRHRRRAGVAPPTDPRLPAARPVRRDRPGRGRHLRRDAIPLARRGSIRVVGLGVHRQRAATVTRAADHA
jgi:hypothetical protein